METTKTMDIHYCLSNESYMNENQLVYFKNKLSWLKMELIEKIHQTKRQIKTTGSAHPDILDRSNSLVDIEQQLWVQERNTSLVKQIDAALRRIEDGSFGYCQITGDKIGLRRLEALPFTNLSVQALEQIEMIPQKVF
ncbi:TraR/DksA family transcriptional regulator [Desulfobacula toluolica]|uniref:Transcritional regulator, TraR/DksA family n=1 Tax=Desulfobacula toluolica (strain DSM 7467 / Tol2) TaxID=651182 RepID=K0NAX4_DESTT|nr:conjugal transfer protein TraR [Desulfobacula toluolica]CCK81359.1 transcritional regulator, TraR/DksA family [Desulfobacula toluolica Tol2]